MRYPVVIEKAEDNYSAYVPDLPGCVATCASIPEVEAEIREAIRFHIDGLKADRRGGWMNTSSAFRFPFLS
jgi:predicted RNase H-like HicB family nuclease